MAVDTFLAAMTKIQGEPSAALGRILALVREIVPNARCELQDHDDQICCFAEDHFGNVHEIKLRRYDWVEEIVRHKAQVLRSLVRTGRNGGS